MAHAILAGDAETGVTIQRMVATLDAGDIICQHATKIDADEAAGKLTKRLSKMGAAALIAVIDSLERGDAIDRVQDTTLVTDAPSLQKADGEIDWLLPARKVHDHIRAMNPWPMAFTRCRGKRLLVHCTHVISEDEPQDEPGRILQADRFGVQVACGCGRVELVMAQREGGCISCGTNLAAGRVVLACETLGD